MVRLDENITTWREKYFDNLMENYDAQSLRASLKAGSQVKYLLLT